MHAIVQENESLLNILVQIAPDSSKTTLRSWIKEGRVTVDEQVVKRADHQVVKGQKVAVNNREHYVERKLHILFEDHHLVAIEKPEGLLSVATDFEKEETAHSLLKKYYYPRKVQVVHRIDQDTSGVMLFALSDQGYNGLKALFESHDIERSYCAIVEGNVVPTKGTWKSYVYEDANYVVHSSQNPEKGSIAITHYRVASISARYSRLILTLETGRKNQIRVHCQDCHHPIVGDKKYGSATDPIKRLCLHAASLAFIHPVTGKKLEFISPTPEAFQKLVRDIEIETDYA
jgi:23S rRNA pseudouridine1911/1915/1917 synthase